MVNASPTQQTDDTRVRLDISGDDATIDMGENPAYHEPAKVTVLYLGYRTTRKTDGDTVATTSEVTDITYRITGKEYETASVHPDFLDQPDEWPAWVRDLVDKHNPAN